MKCLVVLGNNDDCSPGLKASDRATVSLVLELSGQGFEACSHLEEGLRYALAAGASRASGRVEGQAAEFEIALVGSGGDIVAARLAEARGCGLVLDVLSVTAVAENRLEVVRSLGRGAREVLTVYPPVVMRVSEEAPNSFYVSRLRRRRIDPTRLPSPGTGEDTVSGVMTSQWELAKPRARTGNLLVKTQGSASSRADLIYGTSEEASGPTAETIIVADAPTASRHLLRFLRHLGFIGSPGSEELEAIDSKAATRRPAEAVEQVNEDGSKRSSGRSPRAPRPVSTARESDSRNTRSRAPRPASQRDDSTPAPGTPERGPRSVGSSGRTRRKPRPVNPQDNA